ncbi:restriction endonuclease subunit S [Bifidobacterium adolescentis]|uniref:restriction endonuclease subunit S n=4 Tax=Bifidobacterium adolescentis TaxID=1680 RepID=UPI00321B0879
MAEQHEKALVPQIRFTGFTDPWEQRKLGELASKRIEKNTNGIKETFTNSAEHGVVSQLDYFDHDITNDANIGNYSVVHPDDFIYNPRISAVAPCGPINRNKLDRNGVMSPLYTVFSVDDTIDKLYLEHYFKTSRWHQFMFLEGNSGARSDRFSISDSIFFEMPIQCPVLEEQELIASFFGRLDSLITLHQRKYDKLCVLKKSMLDKMFPKGGSLYPEIRFAGFTDPWEQRKLGELVEIERGGSPRPIEQYITDDPCGLNWVKIGDAPELGRYITKTAEKIKPEGLSKTRQVYPGDLVLSNSMSFGRPYIMAIKGCVHDGWLLIRDAQKHFDPIFLCHMLGAPQMLNQYRMFAAGSTVNNLNKELVGNAIVSLPSKNEQHEIGIALDRLDSLITLHQRKLELLRNIKKSMLDKMFV